MFADAQVFFAPPPIEVLPNIPIIPYLLSGLVDVTGSELRGKRRLVEFLKNRASDHSQGTGRRPILEALVSDLSIRSVFDGDYFPSQ